MAPIAAVTFFNPEKDDAETVCAAAAAVGASTVFVMTSSPTATKPNFWLCVAVVCVATAAVGSSPFGARKSCDTKFTLNYK